MIQAADVGVGISGEEGLQAVNSSDYAIAQFRFLKRLLLVHGHWSYARNGNMIVNFFYKNIVCIGVLWWFQIYCGWSSQYVFEYTFLLWWNSFWTIAPVIAIGLFDRIVDGDVLMALPELYRYGREGHWFSMKLFLAYMLDGIAQSTIIYFLILYGYYVPTSRSDGYDVARSEFSTVMVISAVFVANFFNGLETNVWTGWVFFCRGSRQCPYFVVYCRLQQRFPRVVQHSRVRKQPFPLALCILLVQHHPNVLPLARAPLLVQVIQLFLQPQRP